ncbi:hypothetical protein, partial [Sinorhizobium terangae]|uniref:hypothetical protein n=1 Tax=Sinorhizobium terangae TaxID=110322 RepID=UPI001AED8A96
RKSEVQEPQFGLPSGNAVLRRLGSQSRGPKGLDALIELEECTVGNTKQPGRLKFSVLALARNM